MSFIRTFIYLIAVLGVTQLTRFENEITLSWDGRELTATTHQTTLRAKLPPQTFHAITGSFQQSHWGEAGVSRVAVTDGEHKEVFSEKRSVLYLFGHSLWGRLMRGDNPFLQPSFDDWTAERPLSASTPLYTHQLPTAFTARITVVGRGMATIGLRGADEYRITVRDGFIDNDTSLSTATASLDANSLEEEISTNARRITNFFAQMLCGGLTLLVLVELLRIFPQRLLLPFTVRLIPLLRGPWILSHKMTTLTVMTSAAVSFALSFYFAYYVVGGIPHIPDSAVYYKQAILLAQGSLSFPRPELSPLELFVPNGAVPTPTGYTFHYSHFWPALLSVALKLHVAPALNPLLSALSVILVYLVAERLYDSRSGMIAAILSALSPFVIIMSGDFMTHTATYFLVVASIFLTLSHLNKPGWLVGISCGLTWGYALAMRPLSVGTIAAACAVYAAFKSEKSALVRLSVAPILGPAVIAPLYFIDNWVITGKPLISPYTAFHGVSVAPRNLVFGCNWIESTLGFLPQILFAPPLGLLVLALAAVPLVIERSRKEVFLCSILPLVVVAHCFYNSHGIHGYGPRFLFESLFAIFISAGRGAVLLWDRASNAVRALLIPASLIIIAYNTSVLVKVLPSYRNYNGINSDLASEIQKLKNQRAVVLAESAAWYSLDVATTLFDPTFRHFIILGKSPDGSHENLLSQLEGRPVYKVINQQLIPAHE